MLARAGKKEIWLGMASELDPYGNPQLEIIWGRDDKNRAVISFEDLLDDELGQHEQGGPNSGGPYDEWAIEAFTRMRKVLKRARKHARDRNAL